MSTETYESMPVLRCAMCETCTPHHVTPDGLVCGAEGCGETNDPDPLGDALRAAEALGHRMRLQHPKYLTRARQWQCDHCKRWISITDDVVTVAAGIEKQCAPRGTT